MTGDRIPCIHPRCKRTFKKEEGDSEVICGKHFRALPEELRNEHRRCWREYRKWDRRMRRTSDPLKAARMVEVRNRMGLLVDRNWERIRLAVIEPEKPEGIDNFLQEMGL